MTLTSHAMKGVPEKDGPRIVPMKELMALSSNPKFNEALQTIDRIYMAENGVPSAVSVVRANRVVDSFVIGLHVKEQMKAIDIAKQKHEGKFNISAEEATRQDKLKAMEQGVIPDPTIQKRIEKNTVTFDQGKKA